MKMPKCSHGILTLVIMITFGIFAIFTYSLAQPSVDDTACLDCHSELGGNLDKTSHSPANKVVPVKCISCHVNYSEHVNEPSKDNITRPAQVTPFEALNICSQCHFGKSESDFAHAGEHFKAGVNCSGCHKIHDAKVYANSALTKKSIVETCLNCHSKEIHAFALYSQHPVNSGAMSCIDCHDYFSSKSEDFTTKTNNQTCYKCHGEMDGPFFYEHEPTRDFGPEDGGCVNCHDPHGSPFANLLKEQPSQLCLQCHQVPPGHEYNSQHQRAWAGVNCLECHVDIHGSDADKFFLDRVITTQGNCYGSGCHPLGQ